MPSIFGDRLADEKDKEKHLDAHDSFVSAMNRKAAELGMKSTHFNNPNGLPSDGHQTTARDLAHLAFVAFQVPEFKKIVGTPRHGYTLDSVTGYKRNIEWRNTNQLLKTEGLRRYKDRHHRRGRATASFRPASATGGG